MNVEHNNRFKGLAKTYLKQTEMLILKNKWIPKAIVGKVGATYQDNAVDFRYVMDNLAWTDVCTEKDPRNLSTGQQVDTSSKDFQTTLHSSILNLTTTRLSKELPIWIATVGSKLSCCQRI